MTVRLYRCKACGEQTPSPGRLEGNWCPSCKKVGSLGLDLTGEALGLARAIGSEEKVNSKADAERFAALVGAAEAGAPEAVRADLAPLRAPENVRILFFLEEEGGSAAIIDVFRACKFRTKTHCLRQLLLLRQAQLVQALENDRWVLTKRARDAIEAVRMAAG